MLQGIMNVFSIIVFFIIVFGISNTMYMVITDRTQEIGTLRAIGNSKAQIVGMFFFEGFLMGIIGALSGTIIALISIPIINTLQLTLPPGPGQDSPTPIVLTATVYIIITVMIINIAVASVASIFPGISATRKKIVDALRQF
jgi:putative ABC transport system permease protein